MEVYILSQLSFRCMSKLVAYWKSTKFHIIQIIYKKFRWFCWTSEYWVFVGFGRCRFSSVLISLTEVVNFLLIVPIVLQQLSSLLFGLIVANKEQPIVPFGLVLFYIRMSSGDFNFCFVIFAICHWEDFGKYAWWFIASWIEGILWFNDLL